MSETVERVARAIVQADEQNGGPPWDYVMMQSKHAIGPVYDRARAAIAAMRESTEAMEIAAGRDNERGDHLAPAQTWTAMIDEALK